MRTLAQDEADYGEDAHLSVRVSVHLSERTTAEITTYPDEGRATIGLTGYRQSVGVTLFGRTPELRELRDLLIATLATLTDTDTDTGTDADGSLTGAVASCTTDGPVGDQAA
jgi:hypothetical protein